LYTEGNSEDDARLSVRSYTSGEEFWVGVDGADGVNGVDGVDGVETVPPKDCLSDLFGPSS
jgi:hypothetical protein